MLTKLRADGFLYDNKLIKKSKIMYFNKSVINFAKFKKDYTYQMNKLLKEYKINKKFNINEVTSVKASYNNNDFDGSSFEVEDEWIIGAGIGYKF